MKFQVGKRLNGTINKISDLGIFVTFTKQKYGFVHHNDFADNWVREKRKYQVGQAVRVVVIHNYKGKLGLSLKRVNDPALVDPTNQFSQTGTAFAQVMNQTVSDAQKELESLRQELKTNAPA